MSVKMGCDTETYSIGGRGLLSIQVYGEHDQRIFQYEKYMDCMTDEAVRTTLFNQFIDYLENSDIDLDIYYFNLRFDFSQFEKLLVNYYKPKEDYYIRKGQRGIIQSPMNCYEVAFRTKKKGKLIRMRDLANITGSSLNKTAESFLGKEFQKIEIEDKNFERKPMSELEQKYAMRDAELTYMLAVKLSNIQGFNLLTKVTIGSRTLSLFRDIVTGKPPKDIMGIPLKLPFYTPCKDLWSYFEIEKDDIKDIEDHLRSNLCGGICQAWQTGIFEGNIVHLDEHSAHPSQMVKRVPYGKLLYQKPDEPHTSVLYPVGFFKLKDKGLKCKQWRKKTECLRYHYLNDYKPGDYVKDFYLDGSYGIWEEEFDIIKQNYDIIDLKFKEIIYFKTRIDPLLTALVNCLYYGKQHSEGAVRNVFKLLLNALYGKLLTNPEGHTIEYIINDEGDLTRKEVDDAGRQPVYLPLGSWIATMSRVTLMQGCISVGIDNLLYSDTDSIIFKEYNDWENDFNLTDVLGGWGLEGEPSKVNIVGPKTYQEIINDKLITKCAGLPSKSSNKVKFGELKEGAEFSKLKAIRDKKTLAINIQECTHTVNCRAQLYRGGH